MNFMSFSLSWSEHFAFMLLFMNELKKKAILYILFNLGDTDIHMRVIE